ncbi:hypothetical protein HD554DRAFT_776917 [Boletus coccyginus]|nr:hypothetical protein HD554DRAFT_776917 [Boletus coccyginus]
MLWAQAPVTLTCRQAWPCPIFSRNRWISCFVLYPKPRRSLRPGRRRTRLLSGASIVLLKVETELCQDDQTVPRALSTRFRFYFTMAHDNEHPRVQERGPTRCPHLDSSRRVLIYCVRNASPRPRPNKRRQRMVSTTLLSSHDVDPHRTSRLPPCSLSQDRYSLCGRQKTGSPWKRSSTRRLLLSWPFRTFKSVD